LQAFGYDMKEFRTDDRSAFFTWVEVERLDGLAV
jgi:hypothetical protein